MQRVKAVISYDGSVYFGFQKQTSTKQTVTHDIIEALSSLEIRSDIIGSGRTDAGVHATGQVIHFDVPPYWSNLEKLTLNLNRKLTYIHIKHITKVSETFHARFSAKSRLYRYVFKTTKPSVFEQKYIANYPLFNTSSLIEALSAFEGTHDFDMFRKTGTHTHTSVRDIYKVRYKKRGDYHFIYFDANGFLRAQVRMMVDAAMLCATNKLTLNALKEQVDNQKKHTTSLAPPEGLYLARIIY
ncbi:MAG: tRNA pseudouridine(38-40) synthase TruA [Sulfurovum sp.]|nr:tRNA pseudouridine(38-40) synthase TruA [Sulfurovum sp.]